jgi:polysaccharide export outer membrane protein
MKVPRKLSQNIFASVCSLFATALLVTGCATTPDPFVSDAAIQPVAEPVGAPNTNNSVSPSNQGVRFQVGDQLIITFSDTSEQILPHEERIKEDGNITLPLVGAIKAVGKSDGELQKEIRDKYVPKYYLRLTVGVRYNVELSYSVLGEVRAPGPKSYSGKTTVTKAIGAAGGLTEFADKRRIVLTRANGSKLKVNYKKAIEDSKFDPQVFNGDSIHVPKTWY